MYFLTVSRLGAPEHGVHRFGTFWVLSPWLVKGDSLPWVFTGLCSGHSTPTVSPSSHEDTSPVGLGSCLNGFQFSSAQLLSCVWLHGLQHARLPCPSPTPRVYSNLCPLSRRCHPTISSSVIPFSPCLQSFPASGSFLMSHFFTSDGPSAGVSASASVLRVTCLISLQSKGLSRVFSNTTVQKHQFFGTQLSLSSNSHILTWLLEKP